MINYLKKKEKEHIDVIDNLKESMHSMDIMQEINAVKSITWHENELKHCRMSIERFSEK